MKHNLALIQSTAIVEPTEMYCATVDEILVNEHGQTEYRVLLADHSHLHAVKAVSCLVLPTHKASVLVAYQAHSETAYILHVLTQVEAATTIELGAEACVQAGELKLASPTNLSLEAPQLNLSALQANASFAKSAIVSESCELHANKMALVVNSCERVAHTVIDKISNCFRTITGIEATTANRLRTLVKGRYYCKARQVTVNADEEVAIDGDKIHLG